MASEDSDTGIKIYFREIGQIQSLRLSINLEARAPQS
jgi:hypothetical protein